MNGKGWLAATCLIAGIPLAAYGLAGGGALPAVAGLALLLAFWFLASRWIAQAGKPATPIKPAANAAWAMLDQAPAPSASPASGGAETDGGAPRRGSE